MQNYSEIRNNYDAIFEEMYVAFVLFQKLNDWIICQRTQYELIDF